jgi:hypothetical protein
LPKPAGCDPTASVSKPSVKKPVPDPAPPSVEGPPLVPLAEELAVPADPVPELEAALVALLDDPEAPLALLTEPEAALVAAEKPPDPVLLVAASEVLAPVVLGAPLEPSPFDGVEWVLLHAAKQVAAATQDVARQRIIRSPARCKARRRQERHVLADLSGHAMAPARERQGGRASLGTAATPLPPRSVSLALQRGAPPTCGRNTYYRHSFDGSIHITATTLSRATVPEPWPSRSTRCLQR